MSEMKVKIHGHEKAMDEYVAIRERGNYTNIVLDLETGEVWCDDEFVDPHSYVMYNSNTIVGLTRPIADDGEEINIITLEEYGEMLLENFWAEKRSKES